jgi:hypothetical protein
MAPDMAPDTPPEIRDLLGVLPAAIRHELEATLRPPGRAALLAEVRALLLESLRHSGGDR